MQRADYTDDDKNAFQEWRYHHPDPRIQRRFEILWLHACGKFAPEIAPLVKQNPATDAEVVEAEVTDVNEDGSFPLIVHYGDGIRFGIKLVMEGFSKEKLDPTADPVHGRPCTGRLVPTRDGVKLSEAEQKEYFKAISDRYNAIREMIASGGNRIPDGIVLEDTAGEWHYVR